MATVVESNEWGELVYKLNLQTLRHETKARQLILHAHTVDGWGWMDIVCIKAPILGP
jgi:hypothetical protein